MKPTESCARWSNRWYDTYNRLDNEMLCLELVRISPHETYDLVVTFSIIANITSWCIWKACCMHVMRDEQYDRCDVIDTMAVFEPLAHSFTHA